MELCLLSNTIAQHDSAYILQQIEVTAQRIDITDIGKHSDRIDSTDIQNRNDHNLASLISNNSPLFVRSYGPGTLATLGVRGGSAAHTQILWNGIPLRNPMVGLVDLSLIPVHFIDEAGIHYGGHGAAFGSGAIGGLISVRNDLINDQNAIEIGTDIGSWGYRCGKIKLDYGLEKIRFSTRLFSQQAINDFKYRLTKELPEKRQVHHRLSNMGILQEISFPAFNLQTITARVWYQLANRQIPPTSTQNNSKASQQDKNFRASLQWDHKGEKIQWQLKSAWLDETINYQDSLILLYTHNSFTTWLAEAGVSFYLFGKLHFTGGIYTESAEGESGNYVGRISRDQTAFYSSFRYATGPLNLRFQAREEVTTGQWSPLLYDISAELETIRNLILKTSYSRNYRTPTLNDLHWRPGGNPALQPEDGWTYEAGINYSSGLQPFTFKSSATFYTRMIDNWIMWMPPVKDGSPIWAPINVAQVKSEGLETRLGTTWSGNQKQIDLNVGIDLTWSTFNAPLPEFNIQAGDQLFYVPVENFIGGLGIRLGNWAFQYDHRIYSEAPGINEQVKAFNVGSTVLRYTFARSRITGNLFFQVDNVWDTPYRVIERRPMPGRTFTGGIKFSFS